MFLIEMKKQLTLMWNGIIMLLGSTEQASVVVRLMIFNRCPVELMIEHQGAKVSMREHESSSGF